MHAQLKVCYSLKKGSSLTMVKVCCLVLYKTTPFWITMNLNTSFFIVTSAVALVSNHLLKLISLCFSWIMKVYSYFNLDICIQGSLFYFEPIRSQHAVEL